MKQPERSAYDVLSATNKKLVDLDIAVQYKGVTVKDGVSLGSLRERGADDIESLLRSKAAITKEAREAGIKPNDPVASFPDGLKQQAILRSR